MIVRTLSRLRRTRPAARYPAGRKLLESALRDCREMLEETQRIAQIGSWRFDTMRRRAQWTSEVARIFEIEPRPAANPDLFLKRVHREDRDRVVAAYNEAACHGAMQVIDYRLRFSDGRIKDVRERRIVRHTPDGRVCRISGTVQDMTECKLAEAMLESEKSRLRTFLNAIPDLLWIKDTEGIYLACNPVFECFFGAKEAEIAGKSDIDFVDARLAALFVQQDREAMATRRPCIGEEWVRLAHDGRRVLLETITTPFYDDQGHVAGVVGIGRDITERKRVEEQLHLREQDFRTIAENTPDPIARYDSECRCVYMNPALQRLLGKDAREFLDKTPLEASRNLDVLRPYEQKIREALRTGRETQLELISDPFYRAGRPICDHIRFTPEFGCDGKAVSVLAVGRDIANFKAVERQLSYSGAMLRTLVARQEKEREAERKRVAWEVHEELGQLLAALRFNLYMTQESNDAASQPKHSAPPSSIQLLDRALSITRSLASSLRPRVLDLGIKAAMEWLAADFTRCNGIPCTVQCHEELDLDEEKVTVLFRIAQEVLSNIAGHAEAKSAAILVERRGDDHVLAVRDDGRRRDCAASGEGKLDLLRIHERVRTIGGTAAVLDEGGCGTVLEVRIPASPASSLQQVL